MLLYFLLFGVAAGQFDLDYETAARLAGLPLHCRNKEYPNKLSQTLHNASELLPPSVLHPVFYGCFDWHSAVHGHWLMAKVGNLFPEQPIFNNISQAFAEQLDTNKVMEELEYFEGDKLFERTYGWAWLLKLQAELQSSELEAFQQYAEVLKPLATHIEGSYMEFLPRLAYPLRVGEHPNSAFGLIFALEYARLDGNEGLEKIIRNVSISFFKNDTNCPINYEPSGADFLSPCLQEADLMSRLLTEDEDYLAWLENFLPQLFDEDFSLTPGEVNDRTDGKLVHLDGVNFSRAWNLYNIAARTNQQMRGRLIAMGDEHILASIDNVVGSDYAGSHWLASFLFHALETRFRGQ